MSWKRMCECVFVRRNKQQATAPGSAGLLRFSGLLCLCSIILIMHISIKCLVVLLALSFVPAFYCKSIVSTLLSIVMSITIINIYIILY